MAGQSDRIVKVLQRRTGHGAGIYGSQTFTDEVRGVAHGQYPCWFTMMDSQWERMGSPDSVTLTVEAGSFRGAEVLDG